LHEWLEVESRSSLGHGEVEANISGLVKMAQLLPAQMRSERISMPL